MVEKKHIRIFNLPFKGLVSGVHTFEYEIKDDFFSSYDTLSEYEGVLQVKVLLHKKENSNKIDVLITGELKTTCDRCLDSMVLPLCVEDTLYIKIAEEDEQERENVIFVAEDDKEVDLCQLFYEIILTGIPQNKKHEIEDCNAEMIDKLTNLEKKKEIDPRWKELEKLIRK